MPSPIPPEAGGAFQRSRETAACPTNPHVFAALGAAGLACLAATHAGTIYWGSTGLVSHHGDCGTPGDCHKLRMELGVFRRDFLPSPDNVPQWRENWRALSMAGFDPDERRFAGAADDTTPLPDGFGPQAYVWTFDGTDLAKGPQWQLLSHPSWQWSGSDTAAPARTWIADDAVLAILGTIDSGGARLASARVRPEAVPMNVWLARLFPENAAKAHPDADPDGDGLSNRLEYFLGTDPNRASSLGRPEMTVGPQTIRLALNRNPHAVSTFVLESSEDLETWKPAAADVIADRPDQIELLAPKPPGAKPRFFRFQLRSTGTQ